MGATRSFQHLIIMTRQQFDELMDKHLNGSASQKEEQELFDWYALMQDRAPEDNKLEEEDSTLLFAAIKQQIATPEIVTPTVKSSLGWIGIAAAIFLVLFSILSGLYIFKKDNSRNQLVNISTIKDQKKKVILPDGTLVWLNAESKLNYPAQFSENKRELWLSGEGYFEVKHDAKRPFIVHTTSLAIRVLGTVFNVKAYPNEQTETSLLKGSVEVTLNHGSQQQVRLKPFQKLIAIVQKDRSLKKGEQLVRVGAIAHDLNKSFIAETAWTQQKFSFSSEDLAAITHKLEQVYGVKIIFQDPQLRDLRFTGTFDNASMTTVLNALQFSNEFEYRKEGEETIIIY